MRTNLRIALTLVLMGLLGTGCAGTPGTPDGTSRSPSPDAPGSPEQVRTLVSYQRTGGFAGLDDRLVVRTDGSYTITSRYRSGGPGKLSPSELAALRRVLEDADFAKIPATNPPPYPDGFEHRVGYAGHEVRAGDGAIPRALDPVIAALTAILERHGSS